MSGALAKLQIARKELHLDEPTYRAMLERLTGSSSARGLSEVQIGVVLDEMKSKGWKPRPAARATRSAPRLADSPMAKKARALWLSLWQLGEVRDPSEAALESFARRQLGCERLQWADQGQAYKLIEALKAWGERAGWSQPASATVFEVKLGLLFAQCQILAGIDLHEELPATVGAERWREGRLDAEIMRLGALIRKAKAPE